MTMMFSRSTCAVRQYLQGKLLTINRVCLSELQGNYRKNVYEYKQTRNFKNFGHTKRKSRFREAIPIIICGAGMIITACFDWQRMLNIVPKVDAASILAEETQNNENVDNIEQDLQKKKKNKKQKIGFRNRKVY